jgi:hypothetical protein
MDTYSSLVLDGHLASYFRIKVGQNLLAWGLRILGDNCNIIFAKKKAPQETRSERKKRG